DVGGKWLLGDKCAFINVSEEMLLGNLIELLPPKRTVLELLQSVHPSDRVMQRCRELQVRGYRIALDNPVVTPDAEPLLQLADYIKIDVLALSGEALLPVHVLYAGYDESLIAVKVETSEQFEACRKMGFEYFQGFYFAKPETIRAKV